MSPRAAADQPHLYRLTATSNTLEISSHTSGAVRIRLGRGRRLPPYTSLAVVEPDATAPLRARPNRAGIAYAAAAVTAQVTAKTLNVSFALPGGPSFAADQSVTIKDQAIKIRKACAPDAVIYGLGEKTGWLDKRQRRYKMRNTDVFLENPAGIGYTTDPLYASFPVFIVNSPASTYGIFVDNPEFVEFDFTGDDWYEISAPARVLTYYVLPGPALPDVLRQYSALTGRMPLPALWSLGYHQCRWGYKSAADLRHVTGELRRRRHPADGIWLDIDYMDGYRVFTWDREDFPDPAGLMTDLRAEGFQPVTIVDPGVKVDEAYEVYQTGRAGDHFVKHSDGREYNGSVWPGRSAFPDFHRSETRAWWADMVGAWARDYAISGVWNDMNEPAATDISGPIGDTRHNGGLLPHTSARNTYALQMARAAYAGLLQRDPDSRPFILTRAAFSGAQALTALWGGDNHAYWEHLAGSLPLLLNLGLSGMPFVGVDIGGFAGDTHAELFTRWTQAGAFYPFCRNHAAADSRPHEPWVFGPEIESICQRYIELRYQLLPYFYNVFREAALSGAPVMRPLAWHYPKDPSAARLFDQFMIGADLLVAPIMAPGQTSRKVYLPAGRWHRWGSDEAFAGPAEIVAPAPLAELPLFVRAGAILPTWPVAQHTGAVRRDQTTLHIWPGAGRLDYYEDDGATRAFERGPKGWRITPITVRQTKAGLTVTLRHPSGGYETGRRDWTVVVHGVRLRPATGKWNRAARTATLQVPDDGQPHKLDFGPV